MPLAQSYLYGFSFSAMRWGAPQNNHTAATTLHCCRTHRHRHELNIESPYQRTLYGRGAKQGQEGTYAPTSAYSVCYGRFRSRLDNVLDSDAHPKAFVVCVKLTDFSYLTPHAGRCVPGVPHILYLHSASETVKRGEITCSQVLVRSPGA